MTTNPDRFRTRLARAVTVRARLGALMGRDGDRPQSAPLVAAAVLCHIRLLEAVSGRGSSASPPLSIRWGATMAQLSPDWLRPSV